MNEPVLSPRTASSIMHLCSSRSHGAPGSGPNSTEHTAVEALTASNFPPPSSRKSLPEHAPRSRPQQWSPDSAGLPRTSLGRTPRRPRREHGPRLDCSGLSSTPLPIKCFLGAPEALLSAHLAPLLFSEVESAATEQTGSVGDKGGPGRDTEAGCVLQPACSRTGHDGARRRTQSDPEDRRRYSTSTPRRRAAPRSNGVAQPAPTAGGRPQRRWGH